MGVLTKITHISQLLNHISLFLLASGPPPLYTSQDSTPCTVPPFPQPGCGQNVSLSRVDGTFVPVF